MPDTPRPDTPLPFRLRAAVAAPAGWPPDVLPNQIITAAHINSIRSSAYAWPGDVDGQFHTLRNVNLVGATGVLADPTTTAGDLIARGAALDRFPIGAQGQVLTVDTAQPAKLRWITPATAPVASVFGRVGAVVAQAGDYTAAMVTGALPDPLTTKGDLIARGAVTGRMPIGLDGQVLRVDSAQTFGLRWGGESVPSVFGRTGPIVAQAGDYTAAQVSNAVSSLGSYPDPAWIPSLSWAKVIGAPATFPPSAHTHDAAAIVSGVMATARLGTGVADATVYLRGDGTWAAAGTGGGGGVVSVFGRAGNVVAQAGDYTAGMITGAVVDPTAVRGDLIVRNDLNSLVRLPVGASGQVLQADNTLTVGMKWTNISAAVQTPWVTDIDGANFQLLNVRRLGIAMALPAYPLDVTGDINLTGTLRKNGVPITFGGSQTPWTSDINAANFMLYSAGKIGIGTAVPGALLGVVGASADPVAATRNELVWIAGTSGVTLSMGVAASASTAWIQSKWLNAGDGRVFSLSLNPNGGNVGIGTASPISTLHVNSPAAAGGPAASGSSDSAIQVRFVSATVGTALDFGTNGSGACWLQNRAQGNFAVLYPLALNPVGGSVGIGTTGPSCALDVNAQPNSAQVNVIRWGTAANTFGLLTTDQTAYFSGALALFKNSVLNTFISGNGVSYLMGGPVGIGMIPNSLDVLHINAMPFAANQAGGIRIQTAGSEWIARIMLRSNASAVPRLSFDVPNTSAGGVQESFAIEYSTGFITHVHLPTGQPAAGNGSLWVDASGFVKFIA